MSHRHKIISIRLDPETLKRLKRAAQLKPPLATFHPGRAYHSPYNRSQMIRHAINTGLDVLTQEPPLQL